MSSDGLPAVPSAEQYRRILAQLQGDLPETHVELLRAHHGFPDHTATATELAAAVGYDGWRAVNLQYGLLGERLRDALDYHAEGQAPYVIASFVPPGARGNSTWLWVMHPELAQPLEQLGWVQARPTSEAPNQDRDRGPGCPWAPPTPREHAGPHQAVEHEL